MANGAYPQVDGFAGNIGPVNILSVKIGDTVTISTVSTDVWAMNGTYVTARGTLTTIGPWNLSALSGWGGNASNGEHSPIRLGIQQAHGLARMQTPA